MIFHRLKLIHNYQRGFTLIELLVVIAITALITGGITMSIFQVLNVSARSSNHMVAVKQVENAGHWISRDTLMAQIVDTEDDAETPETELVTLTWAEYNDGDEHQVVYTIVDDELKREHYTNSVLDATTMVAQYIDTDPTKTNCVFTSGKLTLTVTATLGGWPESATETRVYEIIPRPGS